MKVGDIVVNVNSESGELGIFLGWGYSRSPVKSANDYKYGRVMWAGRAKLVSTIQPNLIRVIK